MDFAPKSPSRLRHFTQISSPCIDAASMPTNLSAATGSQCTQALLAARQSGAAPYRFV